jgi:hypothetical protein
MTTSHELQAIASAEDWFKSLDPSVRINYYTTQQIHELWQTNSPKQLAIAFADAVNQRVWEQVPFLPAVASKREIRSYSMVGWLRDLIGAEPDEFMRTIAGHNPSANEGSNAAELMIRQLAAEEPDSLRELCQDYRHGETNMIGWDGLLKQKESTDPAWGVARAALQEAVKNGRGGNGANQHTKSNSPHRGEKQDPTLGKNGMPTDRKSRLIRTFTNLENNPDECEKKGTTPEKVAAAKSRLVRGLSPSCEASKREAGIALSTKPSAGLGVRGAADDVAKRLIRMVGADHAKRIATAILETLKNV